MTKIELELIPDPDMHIIFDKDKRGGNYITCNRYSKANNIYLKFYDPKEE